jgi:hypothetical protein
MLLEKGTIEVINLSNAFFFNFSIAGLIVEQFTENVKLSLS